jgi:predicted dehydrogenase
MGIPLFVDAERMIREARIDTVVLCTPHSAHARWVERLAPLGVDLMVPKTFATSPAQADRMVEAEKRHRIRVSSGPTARFLPSIAAAKRAVDRGMIGEPFSFRVMHHHGTLDVFDPRDWYRQEKEGGPELSLGWYVIDLVLHFLGRGVQSVYAQFGNFTSPDSAFMDVGQLLLRMRHGPVASCNMYFCHRVPHPSWELEIAGPKGVIRVVQAGPSAERTEVVVLSARGKRTLSEPARLPHWERYWAAELRDGRPLSVTARDARQITLLSLAARRSSRSGRAVKVTGEAAGEWGER